MLRKIVSGIMLTLLLIGVFTSAFNFLPVKSTWTGTVYIRADGSIDPPDAPIITYDNVTYKLTDNIASSGDGIVIERDNIIIDGAGYTLKGTGAYESKGIILSGRTNVTVQNTQIINFFYGIVLGHSSNNSIVGNNIANNQDGIRLSYSSNNNIVGNNIANNVDGIRLDSSSNNNIGGNNIVANYLDGIWLDLSSNNNIVGNSITATHVDGICLDTSTNNNIVGNNIANNWNGIWLDSSSNNNIFRNNMTANHGHGICLNTSTNNNIFHNNFIDNAAQVYLERSYGNAWDDDYPSGGNYWDNYTDVDNYSGPYQNETGSDGIWDHPYVIDENNIDRYPLSSPLNMTVFHSFFPNMTLLEIGDVKFYLSCSEVSGTIFSNYFGRAGISIPISTVGLYANSLKIGSVSLSFNSHITEASGGENNT